MTAAPNDLHAAPGHSTAKHPAGHPASEHSPIPVAVFGAHGRMGTASCEAVRGADDMTLIAAIGPDDDRALADEAHVMIDFTVPDATLGNVLWAIKHGIHCVVGTTGWDENALESVRSALAARPEVGVLIAPNFAIGAVLTMRFAAIAARYFDSAEVIEMHHPRKRDAPSGTALHTARAIAAARADAGLGAMPDATEQDPDGARGANIDGVRVHAVRQTGLVAHEVVQFGGPGEQFTVRHDSFDRESFMPGVLLAVRKVAERPGLTVGLEHYLDLTW